MAKHDSTEERCEKDGAARGLTSDFSSEHCQCWLKSGIQKWTCRKRADIADYSGNNMYTYVLAIL